MASDALAFRNAVLYVGSEQLEGDLLVVGDRIDGVGQIKAPPGVQDRDLNGRTIAPGLVDLEINGLTGVEVYEATPRALRAISAAAPRFGCTALLPTMITASEAAYLRLFQAVHAAQPEDGARILGLHLEGPYLNPTFRGAHPPELIHPPDVQETGRLLAAAEGSIAIWTLAPELPGAERLVDLLIEHGVLVAAGHSGLTMHEACCWFDRGIRLVTHLFNAMSPLHHREPGLPGAALMHTDAKFSLIVDGEHVHPELVNLIARHALDRLILITDAHAPAGAPPGQYTVARQEVTFSDGVPRLPDGRLAGSGLTALQAVRNLARYTGCTPAQAFQAMTARPADLLGASDLGRLQQGARADFLILDAAGELQETWIGGNRVFAADST